MRIPRKPQIINQYMQMSLLNRTSSSRAVGHDVQKRGKTTPLLHKGFLGALVLLMFAAGASCGATHVPRFVISFPASTHSEPITGRVLVVISKNKISEPRFQIGSWNDPTEVLGVSANQLKPGHKVVVDSKTLGYPIESLKDLPSGNYYVQAVLVVYTEFHRADGHTIWAHMDPIMGHWPGKSGGNLYSDVQTIHLSPTGYSIHLTLKNTIPLAKVPANTRWVKHIKLQSRLLTRFWGSPMYVSAMVLLPKGYDSHPKVYYPVVYEPGITFSFPGPMGIQSESPARTVSSQKKRSERRTLRWYSVQHPVGASQKESNAGYRLFQAWDSRNFPRMIVVALVDPTPFFDSSYDVNSANDGPYGDAIMKELIPYVETHFRIIRKPYARLLTGRSTGGWESLSLQLRHPKFFGGTWTFDPDPIDFRWWQLINVYKDENAFSAPGLAWVVPERPWERSTSGQVLLTQREESQLEAVLGSHGRSGLQVDGWQAVYGPVGRDGYPEPIWNKKTGKIDHKVAEYMKEHGFDLTYYARTHWSEIGPNLVGKLHLYCGEMDNYYLNPAVYSFQDFLASTKDPHYAGTFHYGRPMKGHSWRPMSWAIQLREMAKAIDQHAPKGARTSAWRYR